MNHFSSCKPMSKINKPQQEKQNVSLRRFNRKNKQNEGKITMQLEEEEDPEEFSIKHVAAARYLRNHRLINEIFGDTIVPDLRSVVTTSKIQVLKKQVQSLTMHQKKLEAELQQIDEKFEAKKRKFSQASEQFQEEMRKRCSLKPIDSIKFQKMVEQALEQLKNEKNLKEEIIQKNKEFEKSENIQIHTNNDPVNDNNKKIKKEGNKIEEKVPIVNEDKTKTFDKIVS